MKCILTEWCSFCEGKEDFDSSYFHTLFWEEITEDDLKEIFKYFPNPEQLFKLTSEYLFGEPYIYEGDDKKTFLIDLALKDFELKRGFIVNPELQEKAAGELKGEYSEDYDFVIEQTGLSVHGDILSELEFELTEKWIIEEKKAFALYEAFYGLTKDYQMVWHLFSPLIQIDTDFEHYYILNSLGANYVFYDNKIVVAERDNTVL